MIKIIKTDAEYKAALKKAETLIEIDPSPGTANGDRLELLTLLISNYERDRFPLKLPDPIEAIKFRMEQQSLSQRDLIPYIGSRSKVSEVLRGKRPLSLKMIRALNKELGIPAEVLLQEPGVTIPSEDLEIEWDKFPITEMVKRKWFPNFRGTTGEAKERAEELLRDFFKPLSNLKEALCRYRIRSGSTMDKYALIAWQAKVLNIAQSSSPITYNPHALTTDFLGELVKLSYFDEGPRLAKEFLEKNGIHMVILRHLPKTYLDGAAMCLQDGVPVVALTLRHDRLDNFWFCLCHELAHVVLHLKDGKDDCFMDDLEVGGDEFEDQADNLARDVLVPPNAWQDFLQSYSKSNFRDFADKLRIQPAIIAGRIQYEEKNYRILSRLVGRGEVRKHFEL